MLAYLSRYTHRVAISNSRLVATMIAASRFRWKDYREHGRTRYKTMTLRHEEFMRRFLLHVLPSGFHRIRHYGLLANANRKHDIPAARELLHQPPPTPPAEPGDGSTDHAPTGPPSSADTAAPRCSSSRPSPGLSTSAGRRPHRFRHEHPCSTPQSSPSALHRARPTRTPIDTAARIHRSCTRASPIYGSGRTGDYRPQRRGLRMVPPSSSPAHCLRSNPHSSSHPLTASVRPRGFLPWGLPDDLPSHLAGYGMLSYEGQISGNP